MSRFKFNFAILTNRKTFRDLNEDSPLRALLETVRSELTEREGVTLEFTSDGLNALYDARFITKASGDDLDKWGETLDLARTVGETDSTYRARLLDELRDFTSSLTVEAIKDKIFDITGEQPDIVQIWSLAPDWPLEWWMHAAEPAGSYVTWCNWNDLVDFLTVLDEEPGEDDLTQIVNVLEEVKFAPAMCLVVTDSGSGNFSLVRLVG